MMLVSHFTLVLWQEDRASENDLARALQASIKRNRKGKIDHYRLNIGRIILRFETNSGWRKAYQLS